MGLSLGMPDSWSDTALRKQVIKTLKKLKNRYKLIDAKFSHGRNAWIELADVPDDTFMVSSKLIRPDSGENYSLRVKFYLMAEALFKAEGKDLNSLTIREAGRQLHVGRNTIRNARRDLGK